MLVVVEQRFLILLMGKFILLDLIKDGLDGMTLLRVIIRWIRFKCLMVLYNVLSLFIPKVTICILWWEISMWFIVRIMTLMRKHLLPLIWFVENMKHQESWTVLEVMFAWTNRNKDALWKTMSMQGKRMNMIFIS